MYLALATRMKIFIIRKKKLTGCHSLCSISYQIINMLTSQTSKSRHCIELSNYTIYVGGDGNGRTMDQILAHIYKILN